MMDPTSLLDAKQLIARTYNTYTYNILMTYKRWHFILTRRLSLQLVLT